MAPLGLAPLVLAALSPGRWASADLAKSLDLFPLSEQLILLFLKFSDFLNPSSHFFPLLVQIRLLWLLSDTETYDVLFALCFPFIKVFV